MIRYFIKDMGVVVFVVVNGSQRKCLVKIDHLTAQHCADVFWVLIPHNYRVVDTVLLFLEFNVLRSAASRAVVFCLVKANVPLKHLTCCAVPLLVLSCSVWSRQMYRSNTRLHTIVVIKSRSDTPTYSDPAFRITHTVFYRGFFFFAI